MRPAALITGARRGIGRAIALALAERGFDLAIIDLVEDEDTARTIAAIGERGAEVLFVRADVSDLDIHERVLEGAFDRFPGLVCLVNNAGIGARHRDDILTLSPEDFDWVWAVNLRGPFFLTQRFAGRMLERGGSCRDPHRSIVTIGSVSAHTVSVDRAEYCIAKAALAMMTQLFAVRFCPHGLGVYEIQPGIIETDMTRAAKDRYDSLIADGLTVLPRWGKPEDVGEVVATAALGRLPYTVGQVIRVDGGLSIGRL